MNNFDHLDVKAIISKLKERKCPACQRPILSYRNCGIYIPYDKRAIAWHFLFAEKENDTFFQVSNVSLKENFYLCFSSMCVCGFISLWNLTIEDIRSILVENKEIEIDDVYSAEKWKNFLEKTENENIRRDIAESLKFIDKYERKQ